MKIIKHGSTHIEPQNVKCRCGCVFEIEDSDVVKNYLPIERIQIVVVCPECHNLITLRWVGDDR